jgi:hypothetical protein
MVETGLGGNAPRMVIPISSKLGRNTRGGTQEVQNLEVALPSQWPATDGQSQCFQNQSDVA